LTKIGKCDIVVFVTEWYLLMTKSTLTHAELGTALDGGWSRSFYRLTMKEANLFVSHLWDERITFEKFWATVQNWHGEDYESGNGGNAKFDPHTGVYYTHSFTTVEVFEGGVLVSIPKDRDHPGRGAYTQISYAKAGVWHMPWCTYSWHPGRNAAILRQGATPILSPRQDERERVARRRTLVPTP
jgi:hypothetical protein